MRISTILVLVFIVNIVQAQKRNLDFYILKAKTFSPLINQAQNENKIAGLDLELMKSILAKPEINLEANVLFAPIFSHNNNSYRFKPVSDGASGYTGYDLAVTDGGQYQSVISIKQPLFMGSSFRTYSRQAAVAHNITSNRISLTTHELEQVISHQYMLCLKDKRSADISLELLKGLEDELLIMKKLVDNAIYKNSDLILMQIELENFKLHYESSLSDFNTDLYDLNLLCGISDTAAVDLEEPEMPVIKSGVVASGFLNSYFLDSVNINAIQAISDLKYKPRVSFFANAGLNAVYLPAFNRFGFSTGFSFNWNIADGNQQKIQKQKSNINLATINFEKQNFLIQRGINKNKLQSQIASLGKRIKLTDNQITEYDQLLKVYHVQLTQGEISVIDFKNVVRDIAAKKQERLMLDMEKQALIISFNYWNY